MPPRPVKLSSLDMHFSPRNTQSIIQVYDKNNKIEMVDRILMSENIVETDMSE